MPKLIAAIRQATFNRPMLTKLLSRVKVRPRVSSQLSWVGLTPSPSTLSLFR